jgi:hypothetical protein
MMQDTALSHWFSSRKFHGVDIYIKKGLPMVKLKNLLKEDNFNLTDLENKLGFDSGANRDPKTGNLIIAKATNDFFNDNQKKIYEHVLAALSEQLGMTPDEVDDYCETNNQYDNALKQIVVTIEKLAKKIESEF